MPLIRANLDRAGTIALDRVALGRALVDLPPGAPVVLLVHGFKFHPGIPEHSPHAHIFSLTPPRDCWKAVSWPRHLGFGRGRADEGLCIAVGWPGTGSIWRAYAQAGATGAALAPFIDELALCAGRPVDVIGHSLGARVALAALRGVAPGSMGRAILLNGAEFAAPARRGMSSDGGRAAEVFNIVAGENALFNGLIRAAVWPADRTIGAGLNRQRPGNWLDIRVDGEPVRDALGRMGYRVPAPKRRVCHWSTYLRPGLFPLYRDLIRRREALPMAHVARQLGGAQAVAGTRLRVPRADDTRLPWGAKTSS